VAAEGIAGLPEQNVSSKVRTQHLQLEQQSQVRTKKCKYIQKRPMIERQF
jgi:hypothetical protein